MLNKEVNYIRTHTGDINLIGLWCLMPLSTKFELHVYYVGRIMFLESSSI